MFGGTKCLSMRKLTRVLFFVLISLNHYGFAQQTVIIPGYTGYAIPEEVDEDTMFTEAVGLHNWAGPHQNLNYFFKVNTIGLLQVVLMAKNETGASVIKVWIANKRFTVHIPTTSAFQQITIGEVKITSPGFYQLVLQPLKSSGKTIADIQYIQLSGTAVTGIQFNAKPRRNAASVHLNYPLPDSVKAVAFYNELTVPKGADIPYSYYMSCGFARGYFGIQVNDKKERRVIFSVWDAGNEAVDRNKVADTNKVKLLASGEGVYASDFGNEGTGGHSHWVYNWKADSTYKFYVTALPDSATQTTTYSGYFYAPELKAWKFIASFRAPRDGANLHHLYSFLEDFVGINGQQWREGYYGNAWVQDENNKWFELAKASFSCDATGRAGDRLDFGGGTDGKRFNLWNGGFVPSASKYGDVFLRDTTGKAPKINLYHHVDSVAQATKEAAVIMKAVKDGLIDTTKLHGVYYKILKEGTGQHVHVTDTVSVFYKGWILNGQGIDSTKNEPAVFALNRLIKGWQYGLPACKVGGKIRLVLPSGLAYSIRSRAVAIPPNSILVFDIEVVAAKEKAGK